MSDIVLTSTVHRIRLRNRILKPSFQSASPRVAGYLTISQLAETLSVSRWWIHHRVRNGTIRIRKDDSMQCYLFPDKPDTLRAFRQLLAGDIAHLDF